MDLSPVFQCGWFVFGTVSQALVIHMIRTEKIPFIQSNASLPLYISTFSMSTLAVVAGFSHFAIGLDMHPLPLVAVPWFVILLACYFLSTQSIKNLYIRWFGEWL